MAFAGSEERSSHVEFRLPHLARFHLSEGLTNLSKSDAWIKAFPEGNTTNYVELGDRVIIRIQPGAQLDKIISHKLKRARQLDARTFVLQAPNPSTALNEAQHLATLPEVEVSYPVMRRSVELHGQFAAMPRDGLYGLEWQLENRNGDGSTAGVDLNIREAWSYTTGAGVTVAIADTGIEMNHPELTNALSGAPHYNFASQTTNAAPISRFSSGAHGTEIAGLISADANNYRIIGAAPHAHLASWVVFTNISTNLFLVSDEALLDMYQYQSNVVSVQNFSWESGGLSQIPVTLAEQIGISNAVTFGRSGRGVVMVRSAGNNRLIGGNANDNGRAADPFAICVGAVRIDGRAASYSNPGACLLVAAPSGDFDTVPGLVTTDLLGTDGVNAISFLPPNTDLSGYVFNSLAFSGTSASAPQISAVAALILSANTNLSYRDVQQILILSSRHFDPGDPDLAPNGAGFLVSHNDGFGVPDAAVAVQLALRWTNRPPSTTVTFTATNSASIPDDALRLLVTSPDAPTNLAAIHTLPGTGPHPDTATPNVPLVYVGLATNPIAINLTNKAALIQRGTNNFVDKVNYAAQAGAAFAVIYNFPTNAGTGGAPGGDQLTVPAGTDYCPIPAVFIGNTDGESLRNFFGTNSSATAQLFLNSTSYVFNVTNTLLCEHVGVRLQTDHPDRGQLRVTLTSPAGTRSVFQRYNGDTNAGPVDWTYYSTHHFFESSAGNWTVAVSDEGAGATGSVHQVSLIIQGVPIVDSDHDGLDDIWELSHFGSLSQGPNDDPDGDGYTNVREQLMGTDPNVPNSPFILDFSTFNPSLRRLSWPGTTNVHYEISGGSRLENLNVVTNIPGRFPETEWFSNSGPTNQFYRVRAVP